MTKPRALFLDLDDTLIGRLRPEVVTRTAEEIAALHPDLDAARLAETNAAVWDAYWPSVEDRRTLGELSGAAVTLEAWRRTLRTCGCADEAVARQAARTFRQQASASYRLFDEVRDLVASARRARIPLALITNGASDTQRDKLSAVGIGEWFDTVVISGEVGLAKPDPRIFEVALEALGLGRDGVWHVGDSLAADVAGAKAAGVTAVWLNRSRLRRRDDDPEPDIEIPSLAELNPLLSAMRGCA